jgi:hypothetical protein
MLDDVAPACASSTAWPWCNSSLPLDARVALLLDEIRDDELPGLLSNDLFGGAQAVPRLNISKYSWISEADHGLLKVGYVEPMPTSFPQVIGLAASFNTSLWSSVGHVTALEARALWNMTKDGGDDRVQSGLLLHININNFRDPRWGRGQETPGECPFLSARYAEQWTDGVQQPLDAARSARHSPSPLLAGAACKHFAACASGPASNSISPSAATLPRYPATLPCHTCTLPRYPATLLPSHHKRSSPLHPLYSAHPPG